MNRPGLSWEIPDEAQLEAVAADFASRIRAPLVIYLEGPLGAGKTTFVRSLARALGYTGRVKSPSYGLLELYDFEVFKLVHLDLYRVEHERELDYLALRDLFQEDSVLLVEWPRRGGSEIPPADIELRFSESITERSLSAVAKSAAGETVLADISR
jgi:tRNA threonylcarbamoyladenosine biosynthesis protein TsaE